MEDVVKVAVADGTICVGVVSEDREKREIERTPGRSPPKKKLTTGEEGATEQASREGDPLEARAWLENAGQVASFWKDEEEEERRQENKVGVEKGNESKDENEEEDDEEEEEEGEEELNLSEEEGGLNAEEVKSETSVPEEADAGLMMIPTHLNPGDTYTEAEVEYVVVGIGQRGCVVRNMNHGERVTLEILNEGFMKFKDVESQNDGTGEGQDVGQDNRRRDEDDRAILERAQQMARDMNLGQEERTEGEEQKNGIFEEMEGGAMDTAQNVIGCCYYMRRGRCRFGRRCRYYHYRPEAGEPDQYCERCVCGLSRKFPCRHHMA